MTRGARRDQRRARWAAGAPGRRLDRRWGRRWAARPARAAARDAAWAAAGAARAAARDAAWAAARDAAWAAAGDAAWAAARDLERQWQAEHIRAVLNGDRQAGEVEITMHASEAEAVQS